MRTFHSRGWRPRGWILAGAAFALLAGAFPPLAPALAHAVLVSATPAPNSTMDETLAAVEILFSEPVSPAFSNISVLSQTGQQVDNRDTAAANADGTLLRVTLPALADGTYLVSWEALSAVDGHTTSGSFPFGVGVSVVSGEVGLPSSTAELPTALSFGARWATLTGTVVLIGLFAFQLLVWRPLLAGEKLDTEEMQLQQRFEQSSLRLGIAGIGLVFLGLALTFLSVNEDLGLFETGNLSAWLGTRFGSMWMARLVTGAALAVSLVPGRKGRALKTWELAAGLVFAAGLALSTSLVSHSAALAEDTRLATAIDLVHVLAAGFWVGGLLQLALTLWAMHHTLRDDEARAWFSMSAAASFSAYAAMSVGLLLTSGAFLAWKHIGSWGTLLGTAYGLTLVAKGAAGFAALGIAAINLLIVKPRLDAAYEEPESAKSKKTLTTFRRLAWAEATMAMLALAGSSLMTDLQRGVDAPLLSSQASSVTLTQSVDDLNITITIEPALVGQNTFDVYIEKDGKPVTDAEEVSLRFTFLGQSIGTAEGQTVSQGDGHYQLNGGYLSLTGGWQVEAAVRRADAFDAFAAFRVEGGLNGKIRPLAERASLPERLATFLTQSGGLVSGAFLVLFAFGWIFFSFRAYTSAWQVAVLMIPMALALWFGGNQLLTFYREYTPGKFYTNPTLPSAESIARGEEIYDEHCAACHGPNGEGDGLAAAGLQPAPADFTAGHTAAHPDGDLYFWIREGMPNSAMPAFGERLEDEEIWDVINFIRQLGEGK